MALAAILSVLASAHLAIARRAPAPAAKPDGTARPAAALDKKIMNEAKNGSEVMADVDLLSDMIGPRLTGSPALKRANEWAADRMRSYGLSNVHLEPYTIVAGWERGTAYARIIEPDNGRTLTLAAARLGTEHQRQSARGRGDFHAAGTRRTWPSTRGS